MEACGLRVVRGGGSDSDPTFHFDVDPDPDPNPTPILQMLEKIKFFIVLFTTVPVYIVFFYLFLSFHSCHSYGSGFAKMVWIRSDPGSQNCSMQGQ